MNSPNAWAGNSGITLSPEEIARAVFLYASYTEKLRRLQLLGKRQAEAEELLDQVDQDRITFVKRYFNADWPTRCLYHVMINTAIGNENVISTILNYYADARNQLHEEPSLPGIL